MNLKLPWNTFYKNRRILPSDESISPMLYLKFRLIKWVKYMNLKLHWSIFYKNHPKLWYLNFRLKERTKYINLKLPWNIFCKNHPKIEVSRLFPDNYLRVNIWIFISRWPFVHNHLFVEVFSPSLSRV